MNELKSFMQVSQSVFIICIILIYNCLVFLIDCVTFKTCNSCVKSRTEFSCAWCPKLKRWKQCCLIIKMIIFVMFFFLVLQFCCPARPPSCRHSHWSCFAIVFFLFWSDVIKLTMRYYTIKHELQKPIPYSKSQFQGF